MYRFACVFKGGDVNLLNIHEQQSDFFQQIRASIVQFDPNSTLNQHLIQVNIRVNSQAKSDYQLERYN
ncbi:hypothetical protein VNO77_19222 [Canavalia gladiata]|uniref:Uncharacterized protein n=1 Tax=Canavalia gladiata TaxID=3824 RepID=A0AAN9LS67_CANGL